MKTLVLAFAVLLLFVAMPATAQVGHDLDPEDDHGCAEDMNTDDCFETGTGTGGGGKDKCVKSTSYATCIARCSCKFEENKKKCKNNGPCLALASAEKSACDGGCLSDYVP